MAYTGTYEQALRKNPTDYKLRAMGKKKYDLKRRKDGKVTISTKDDPKTREGFRSEKNAIEAERKSRKRTKSIFDAVKKIKEEQKSKQREVKTSKDDVRKTDNEGERKRKIEEQNKKSTSTKNESKQDKKQTRDKYRDADIPSQALENLATTVAGGSLLTGVVGYKVYKSAKGKQKLQTAMNKINDLPKDQQKEVGKKIGEKVSDRIKNAKPSLKQKIKTKLAQLKKKISSG
jgi:hypothetical protein